LPWTTIDTSSAAAIIGPGRTAIWPGRQLRPVVQGVDLVHREAVEQALADHHAPAAAVLLGGLEDHVHGAVEVARLGEVARRAEQHRRVSVVPAGVHAAGMPRGVRLVGGLVHGQAVEVGAQADRPAAARVAAGDHADEPGPREAAMHLDAERGEVPGHDVGRAPFLEGDLGMHVDVAAHGDQLVVEAADVRDGIAHGGDSSWIVGVTRSMRRRGSTVQRNR
jgi:hypothetical protein